MAADTVLRVALDVPLRTTFDYLPAEQEPPPPPGTRVVVPFGRRRAVGIVQSVATSSELPADKLRRIQTTLDSAPLLDQSILDLCRWAATYYHHPIGEVIATALPGQLRRGGSASPAGETAWRWCGPHETTVEAELRRAPRQKELAGLLLEHGPCTEPWLAKRLHNNWRAALRALKGRGWVAAERVVDGFVGAAQPAAHQLNPAQHEAAAAITAALGEFAVFLLDGVTGSGKTEVYLQAAEAAIARGEQVLVLLPEISLTPQTSRRFRNRLGVPVVTLHSGLAEGERAGQWLLARDGTARVVIGTRSAAWTPLPDLGLIVVDEEHDPSLKQQEGFRYSARDLVLLRAQRSDIPVVLGSATPSLDSLAHCATGRYRQLRLPDRAGGATVPQRRTLDLRGLRPDQPLSPALREAVAQRLERHEQSLLFLNRRGYAPVLLCRACGWHAVCPGCDRPYTLHLSRRQLVCHYCGGERRVPTRCESCSAQELDALGSGTQRIEMLLREAFPEARLVRIDRDAVRGAAQLAALLERIRDGDADIVLGTQMLAKGHHFPAVTLVGIIDADAALFAQDFRAAERLAQLLDQVGGRCGRGDRPGEVLVQTRQPEHPLLRRILATGYHGIAPDLLEERAAAQLPPHGYLALLRASAPQLADATAWLQRARAATDPAEPVELAGPVPAPFPRRSGRAQAQLLLHAAARPTLHRLLNRIVAHLDGQSVPAGLRWSVDVDPVDLY